MATTVTELLDRVGPEADRRIVASAATVSLGLVCLLVAEMNFNRTLGPVCPVGILCGLACMLTILPAMLVVLGRWVFWPAVPRCREAGTAPRSSWDRIGREFARRPRRVCVGSTLVLAALAVGGVGITTGLDDEHMTTGRPDSVAGQRLLGAHYPAGESRPITVLADARHGATVAAVLEDVRGVAGIQPGERSIDRRLVAVDAVPSAPADSGAARATVQRIRAAVRTLPRGARPGRRQHGPGSRPGRGAGPRPAGRHPTRGLCLAPSSCSHPRTGNRRR